MQEERQLQRQEVEGGQQDEEGQLRDTELAQAAFQGFLPCYCCGIEAVLREERGAPLRQIGGRLVADAFVEERQ